MCRGLSVYLTLAFVASAEDARFDGPLLGHIYDETSQQIRPIVGAPGAAMVAATPKSLRFVKAVVSGDGAVALGYEAGAERLVWINPRKADAGAMAIPESLASFDLAALSPGATSAIVYAQTCNCVQILTELRSDPKAQRAITLPEGGSALALAVN